MNPFCPPECALASAGRAAWDLPVGTVRRLAPGLRAISKGEGDEVDETKRNVLKLLAVAGVVGAAGGGLVGGTLLFAQPPIIGISSYPRVQLLDIDGSPLTTKKILAAYNVLTSDILTFNYPLRNEPNFLLNLAPAASGGPGATHVPGGIGPDGSIVAFSAICQHLACPAPALHYYPPLPAPNGCADHPGGTPGGKTFYLHCTCHGSTYDVTNRASNLTGPAVLPLPQVTLDWNSADDTIFAVHVTGPPVNGHLDTLQGDYSVGSTSQLVKQAPGPVLCNFGT